MTRTRHPLRESREEKAPPCFQRGVARHAELVRVRLNGDRGPSDRRDHRRRGARQAGSGFRLHMVTVPVISLATMSIGRRLGLMRASIKWTI
jgi:hypothetical protein